jgi:hypothetical protein
MGEIASLIQISEAKMIVPKGSINAIRAVEDDLPLVENDLQAMDKARKT